MSSEATIKVMGKCSCNARRWFDCDCAGILKTYRASGPDWQVDETPAPTQKFVDYVRAYHPGATLIYVDLLG